MSEFICMMHCWCSMIHVLLTVWFCHVKYVYWVNLRSECLRYHLVVYELSSSKFGSRSSHLNFWHRSCSEQRVSSNLRMNIYSIHEGKYVCDMTKTHLNNLVSLAKWLSVCLKTKWLQVWILLPLFISSLFQVKGSLTFW